MWFVWPVPIYLAAAALFVWLAVSGRRFFPGTVRARRGFWCPFRSTNVEVDFKKSVWDGGHVAVEGCSHFSPPTEVQCDKYCLLLKALPASKPASPLVEAPSRAW